jgi:hypothetical protein
VTLRLILNFILDVQIYTLEQRAELVSRQTSATVCIAVRRAEIVEKMIKEQREERE